MAELIFKPLFFDSIFHFKALYQFLENQGSVALILGSEIICRQDNWAKHRRIVENGKEFALIGKRKTISDFYKMKVIYLKKLLFILLTWTTLQFTFAQSPLSEYGIRRHGLTIEEPFHTGRNIYQDSLGRLIAHNSVYIQNPMVFDGEKFAPYSYKHKRKLKSNFNAKHWYVEDAFIAYYDNGRTYFEIDVRNYLERNITFLYKEKEKLFLFCNDGFIELAPTEDGIKAVNHHSLGTTRIFDAHFSSDTLYLQTNEGLGYVLRHDSDLKIVPYRIDGLQNRSLFLLPDGKIIVRGKRGKHFINDKTSYYSFLLNQKDKSIELYLDSKERMWVHLRNENYEGNYVILEGDSIPTKLDLGEEIVGYAEVYEDNIGGIWLGSAGQGIFHLYEKSVSILDKESGFIMDNIVGIQTHPIEDKYYIGYHCGGIDIFENGRFDLHLLEKNCQNPILIDHEGRLWTSSVEIRVYENEKQVHTYSKKDGLHSRTVSCLFEDSRRNIWAGTRQVLHKYNGSGFTKYQIPG